MDNTGIITLIGFVCAAENGAARLQLGMHGNVFPLQAVNFEFTLVEYLLHFQIAFLLTGQQMLHHLTLIVNLGEQRVALALWKWDSH